MLPPSSSPYETPLQIHLKNVDLFRDSESYFENSKTILNKDSGREIKNRFEDVTISYQ